MDRHCTKSDLCWFVMQVFQGNTDAETTVTNHLKRAVNARYARIKPQTWNNHIAMRVEVYKGEASKHGIVAVLYLALGKISTHTL